MKPTSSSILTGRQNFLNSYLAEVRERLHNQTFSNMRHYLTLMIDSNEDADHRYMMFSATFNKTCRQVAKKFLEHGYVRIRVGRTGSSHANIEQRVSIM